MGTCVYEINVNEIGGSGVLFFAQGTKFLVLFEQVFEMEIDLKP